MDSAPAQQEEIDALQSIYGSDFTLIKPSNVWKGASALPEYTIRLKHVETELAERVAVTLYTRLPKTYPDKAVPTFAIRNTVGLSQQQVTQLSELVKAEAHRNAGRTMVFDIASFCQEWILMHNVAQKTTPNISLATQMTNRTIEAERKRAQQAVEEQKLKEEEDARRAAEFTQQVEHTQAVQERLRQQRTRKRGHSFSTDATAQDPGEMVSFEREVEVSGLKFDTVRICCRRKEFLWTTHFAEPAYYNHQMTIPAFELYTICFDSQYYTTQQGRKKTREVQEDLKKLIALRNKKESKFLLDVLAVELRHATAATPTKLHILTEQRPPMTLCDILQAAGLLGPEKACDYLVKTLSALNVLHAEGMFHRAISVKCIHVVQTAGVVTIKLSRCAYYAKLVDLYKSNAFSASAEDELRIPQSWIIREVAQNPLQYTRARDLWNVGIVLLQMLYGLNVMERYVDYQAVLALPDFPSTLRATVIGMFEPNKKIPWSCLRLLDELQGVTFKTLTSKTAPIPIPTPRAGAPHSIFYSNSSPETEVGNSPRNMFAGRRMVVPSRYHVEFDELEHLGSGGFGEVVKARNKIDGKIYAVKKIRLRSGDTDARIFREVTTLSRLNHRYIVRYYATWLEEIDVDGEGDTDSATESDATKSGHEDISFVRPGDELDMSFSHSKSKSTKATSFPYIVFGNEDSDAESPGEDEYEEDDYDEDESPVRPVRTPMSTESRQPRQMLYISMEFVEKETLKERVDEGLEEDESWRLFHQVLEALVHIAGLGIIHRDLKPSNIFIDAKGDVKVGDFGLATSSLADVAPSDMPSATMTDTEVTKDVGTRLYVAPEVLSGRSKSRSQAKADMYSLGICFFEMNYKFSTGSERIHVLESLRKPEMIFPENWPVGRERQKQIITMLLEHDPDKRPSALDLSQSNFLPPRVADEFFKETLSVMTRPDSTHYSQVVNALFAQQPNPVKASAYNTEKERLDLLALSSVAVEHLKLIFTKHGAVEMEPPLLGPVTDLYQYEDTQSGPATFLDPNGDLVTLPKNLLVPFARMAIRREITRIKRYYIGDAYVRTGFGHPDRLKVAAFDIITPDLDQGHLAACAEALSVTDECLSAFPGLGDSYKIYLSHSALTDAALAMVPGDMRASVLDILGQSKSSFPQKRVNLLRLGLSRAVVDSLETWNEPIDLKTITNGKNPAPHDPSVSKALLELDQTIKFATALGVRRQIVIRAIMTRQSLYDKGLHFEVNRGAKRSDKFAAGGSYEHLFARIQPNTPIPGVRAVGVQMSVNSLAAALDHYQRSEKQKLQRLRTSFGFWSPRRTDVYVISRNLGQLEERLEVVAMLWSHNISADVMYESALASPDPDQEPVAVARREGILFCVILPASKTSRREFRVKNVLNEKEHEVSRQDLPMWLASEIANQRRIDLTTSGVSAQSADASSTGAHFHRDPAAVGIEILMPHEDNRKQAKWTRHTYHTKVEQIDSEIRAAVVDGIPMIAVDVESTLFNSLVASNRWLYEDDAWRAVVVQFPQKHSNYAWTIKEQLLACRERGVPGDMVMLLCLKDFRVFMFKLTRS